MLFDLFEYLENRKDKRDTQIINNLLIEQIKEVGIANIILDYKKSIEDLEKYERRPGLLLKKIDQKYNERNKNFLKLKQKRKKRNKKTLKLNQRYLELKQKCQELDQKEQECTEIYTEYIEDIQTNYNIIKYIQLCNICIQLNIKYLRVYKQYPRLYNQYKKLKKQCTKLKKQDIKLEKQYIQLNNQYTQLLNQYIQLDTKYMTMVEYNSYINYININLRNSNQN